MKGQVIIVPADPAQPVRHEPRDKQPDLQELHNILGGYIEPVPHWEWHNEQPCVVWCNEEGKLRDLPVNDRATLMWWNVLGGKPPGGDYLVGNVVIVVNLPDEDEEG